MIINISGKQGSGKSTLMRTLQKQLTAAGVFAGHHRFAEVIYEMHDACRDVAWNYGLEFPEKHGRLLQVIGTEAFREAIDAEYWVKATQKIVARTLESGIDVVIIDDCRFPNELNAFKNMGICLNIRLECPENIRAARAEAWRKDVEHPSETGLDNVDNGAFDAVWDTSIHSPDDISSWIVANILKYTDRGAQSNG